jgi:hypothetical protein
MGSVPTRCLATVTLASAFSFSAASPAVAQKFLPDDPLLRDHDDLHAPMPRAIELSSGYDVIENTFFRKGPAKGTIKPASNVNTVGEVPDSSWWTNRIGARPMSIEELVRGPNQSDGPDVAGTWTVIRGKAGGITPGFTIRDSRGDVYFIKLDPAKYFGLSTGAEQIGTRFFHAFGYFVPESWIVYVRKERILVGHEATIRVLGRKPRAMVPSDLERILKGAAGLPDGRLRFVASKAVPGKVIGPHKYFGTRPDDPNDVIPHEDRRELRGYRVFCAWLNHDDSRSLNSLDSYVAEGGRSYVKHYLQDFSSILGSGSDWRRAVAPQNPRAGNEYIIELGPIARTALSFGIWERPWYGIKYEVYPQVGGIEATAFDPDAWRPEFPNAAFQSMLPVDAFWAARIVSKFSDEAIRAIVEQGDFHGPEAASHLARMIIERRDKVVARYLRILNPLADFRLVSGAAGPEIAFTNYGEDAGLGSVEAYEYEWFRFENASGATEPLGPTARAARRAIPLPAPRPEYLMVRIRSIAAGVEAWKKRVNVFLRTTGELKIVGIEREAS